MPAQPLVCSHIALASLSSPNFIDLFLFLHFLPDSWALQTATGAAEENDRPQSTPWYFALSTQSHAHVPVVPTALP